MDIELPKIVSIVGVILAGGQSSRFGSNKALACLYNKPLIEHVADTLRNLFSSCLLVTHSPETYAFLDLPMSGDIFPDAGPLGGIHSALHRITESRAFIVGCDMPMLNPGLIRFLCGLSLTENCDIVLPWLQNGAEPLYAVYHKNALPVIEKNLRRNDRQIVKAMAELKVRKVSQAEILTVVPDLNTFQNVNRPDDLAVCQVKAESLSERKK